MLGRDVAARLVDAGLDAAEEAAKARLFDLVTATCHAVVGNSPVAAWWVPGRLELFGTHTDYAGGRSLVAALPRGFAFAVVPRSDAVLRVIDAAGGEQAIIDPSHNSGRFRGWRHYLEVVYGRLSRNFDQAALGADVVFASDLPRAAGMSSSSALVVGVATALVHVGGLRDTATWRANIHTAVDEAGYLACIENGRTFGTLSGDAGVGTHGGSEDHAAMLTAAAGACSALAFVPMRQLDTVDVPAAWTIVVATSGVRADKTGAVKAAYNRLADGASVLLHLWNAQGLVSPSLAAALASSDGAVERLQDIVTRSHIPGWTATTLRDRLDHFAREDARVAQAVVSLRDQDLPSLAALAAASHSDAEHQLKNQVAETNRLVQCALTEGAAAARSFGAGFGGSVWAVIPGSPREHDADVERFMDGWLRAYRDAGEAGARSVAFVARPGPPVTAVVP